MNFLKPAELPKTAEFLMAGEICVSDDSIRIEMLALVDRDLTDKEKVGVISGHTVEIYLIRK
jgi:hypothetical protein